MPTKTSAAPKAKKRFIQAKIIKDRKRRHNNALAKSSGASSKQQCIKTNAAYGSAADNSAAGVEPHKQPPNELGDDLVRVGFKVPEERKSKIIEKAKTDGFGNMANYLRGAWLLIEQDPDLVKKAKELDEAYRRSRPLSWQHPDAKHLDK